jgi:hypothetical protein
MVYGRNPYPYRREVFLIQLMAIKYTVLSPTDEGFVPGCHIEQVDSDAVGIKRVESQWESHISSDVFTGPDISVKWKSMLYYSQTTVSNV